MSRKIGYCTNVHANANLRRTRENLAEHALAVKEAFSPNDPMGIGLWLSAQTARELLSDSGVRDFSDWLDEVGLLPFTFNGFPYGDFHQPVVKHRVYDPTWAEPARLAYTSDLIRIMDGILPLGQEGSISTLPIAWPDPPLTRSQWTDGVTSQLISLTNQLAELEAATGRLIHVCLEPEPGCLLQRAVDVVDFFENGLLRHPEANEDRIRRYLRVCHDVCHAVVMFESQADVWRTYRAAGIGVGKVQVSSAICVRFDQIDREERALALSQLSSFAEDRYLHQTMVRRTPDAVPQFYEDLPLAIQSLDGVVPDQGEWRVHFHVPIYLDSFGHLNASKQAVLDCLAAARSSPEVTHFEVETYAWEVLPAELQTPKLSDGIAAEMSWFEKQMRGHDDRGSDDRGTLERDA